MAAGFLAAGFLADLAAGLGAGAFFGVALGLATVCGGVARKRRSIGCASEDEGTASTPSSGRSHGDADAATALQGTRHTRLLLRRRLLGGGLLGRGLLGALLGRRRLLLGLGALERADRLEEVDDGRHGCSVWVRRFTSTRDFSLRGFRQGCCPDVSFVALGACVRPGRFGRTRRRAAALAAAPQQRGPVVPSRGLARARLASFTGANCSRPRSASSTV